MIRRLPACPAPFRISNKIEDCYNLNSDTIDVRKAHDNLRKSQTYLVQSSEIATAGVCQNLFKLDYPCGAIKSDKEYLVANTVHDIMSLSIARPIVENWGYGLRDCETVARIIVNDSSNVVTETIAHNIETATKENRFIRADLGDSVNEIFHGLVSGIAHRLMKKYNRPVRAMTEVTITNITNNHEERIDALLEYPNGYGLLDWKSYDLFTTHRLPDKLAMLVDELADYGDLK
jgi:hypothetical protein